MSLSLPIALENHGRHQLGASRTTPFRSLEYVVRGGWTCCFDATGQPIVMEESPEAGWNRLFPNGTGGGGGGSDTTASRVAAKQNRMVDLAAGRFDAVLPTLGTADRQKLENHRDLLHDLEGQLLAQQVIDCDSIPSPVGSQWWSDPLGAANAFRDLTVAALSCGLTDIVTLRMGGVDTDSIGAPPGDLHNDYAHNSDGDPTKTQIMTDFHTWHAERFKELLDQLDAIPEGNGTMLDNTIVVWTNELATGYHTSHNMPIVVAGGTDFFDSGRLVHWAPRAEKVVGPFRDWDIAVPHQKFLTTLGHAMGETSLVTVGLPTLPMDDGTDLDCSGLLDRVCL